MISQPGLYADIPEASYHADDDLAPELGRSLSSSGAKTLLDSPAQYAYERQHPRQPSDSMLLGTAVHTNILGTGWPVVYVDAASWQGKAAQAERAAVEADGGVALLEKQRALVDGMTAAVGRHELAAAMLTDGTPEVSAYWVDSETGVTCRARYDWLRNDGRVIDLKTGADLSVDGLSKAFANFGYDISEAHYCDGLEVLTGDRPSFSWVFVKNTAPHTVRVVLGLDPDGQSRGSRLIRQAREVFADCESNGYPTDLPHIDTLSLPRWAS